MESGDTGQNESCLESTVASKTRLQGGDCHWMKTHWVPAPGKSTHNIFPSVNFSSCISGSKVTSSSNTRRNELQPKKKSSGKRKYTLQTKDSLKDVTTCLLAKRQEVEKMWRENLESKEPVLLGKIEEVDKLALEATHQVEHLKSVIQESQTKLRLGKDQVLTKQEKDNLECLRNRVLKKLTEFEDMYEDMMSMLEDDGGARRCPSDDKMTQVEQQLQPSAEESQLTFMNKNQEYIDGKENKESDAEAGNDEVAEDSSLIVLKQKNPKFRLEEETEDEETDGITKVSYISSMAREEEEGPSSDAPSTIDLSKLAGLYEEKFSFPPVSATMFETSNLASRSRPQSSISSLKNEMFHDKESLFKSKMYQKLFMDQKQEISQLKMDLERVESESKFQMRLLKSKIKEPQIPDIAISPGNKITVPPALAPHENGSFLDKRLFQYASIIMDNKLRELENNIKSSCKCNLPDHLNLTEENESLKAKVTLLETEKDGLSQDIVHCRKENKNLQKELADKDKTQNISRSAYIQTIRELKDQLKFKTDQIEMLTIAKEKMTTQLSQRVEDVLKELEDERLKNSHLVNQIHFIKSAYQNLFPSELFDSSQGELQFNATQL